MSELTLESRPISRGIWVGIGLVATLPVLGFLGFMASGSFVSAPAANSNAALFLVAPGLGLALPFLGFSVLFALFLRLKRSLVYCALLATITLSQLVIVVGGVLVEGSDSPAQDVSDAWFIFFPNLIFAVLGGVLLLESRGPKSWAPTPFNEQTKGRGR